MGCFMKKTIVKHMKKWKKELCKELYYEDSEKKTEIDENHLGNETRKSKIICYRFAGPLGSHVIKSSTQF